MDSHADVLAMDIESLRRLFAEIGEPSYRAAQLFEWLHRKQARSFADMTVFSRELREKLAAVAFIPAIEPVREQRSADGTVKYLFRFGDGNCVESVVMSYHHGLSICVSSQVGCRMGCSFCSSAKYGFVRNLSAAEILSEVYEATRLTGQRMDSVVLMGTGEPLDNFDAVLRFYELVTDENGYALSNRSVSLSTCGIVPRIDELAQRKLQLTLSISLHATDDATRRELMPIDKKYPLPQLIAAAKRYGETTRRRISFEYAVIAGKNDGEADADRLVKLLAGIRAHVNLIPVNGGGAFEQCGPLPAHEFCRLLTERGLTATVRRTLGSDIDAACGQLRNRYIAGGDEN